MITTYKAIGRSTLVYAAPIWAPAISDTHWQNLQNTQNHALRTATGCLLMSSQDHLHQETMVMPIRQHSELLTKQFLAKSFLPNNPGHQHLQPRPPAPELPATLEKDEGESPLYPPSNPRGVQKGPKIPPHCRREEINRGCSPKQRTPISPPHHQPSPTIPFTESNNRTRPAQLWLQQETQILPSPTGRDCHRPVPKMFSLPTRHHPPV